MAEGPLTAEEMEAVEVRYEVISKWAIDTISTFERTIKTYRPSDRLFITTLSVCSTYCNAIRALLQNGLRMPTTALLRVLFELGAKVLWCLNERDADGSNAAVEEKTQRWEKESLRQKINLAQHYQEFTSDQNRETLEQRVKEYKERQAQLKCEPMPKLFTRIVQDLGDSWYKEFYPRLYECFNNAIHLDTFSLCYKAKDDGTTVSVTPDSSEPIEELAQYCVVNMHIILVAIRSHYGWDTKVMDDEFRAVNRS